MLQDLLNLNPYVKNELKCYNDAAVKGLLQIHAKEVVRVKHPFVGLKDKVAYPLYKLACLKPSMQVIKLCHEGYPNAILVTADDQRLPLHAACFHGADFETVHYLVEQYPESVNVGDYQNNRPIHLAIMNQGDTKVLKYLLKRVSESQVDFLAKLLLLSLEHKSSKSFVKALLQRNSAVLDTMKDNEGTALHKALLLGSSVDVIKLFLKQEPNLASTPDEEGWLPLHAAVGTTHNQASRDVVQCLVDSYPKALTITTTLGRCPLHLALRYNAPFEVVELLCNSTTVKLVDRDAHYPLHFACRAQSNIRVVCLLLKMFPDATKMEDHRGMTPLHFSCRYGATEMGKVACDPQVKIKVIQLLVKADSSVLMQRDDDGFSPLELACMEDGTVPFKAKRYMALQCGKLAKKKRLHEMIYDAPRGGPPMQIAFSPPRPLASTAEYASMGSGNSLDD
jgi:ankyrin repeat protein